MRKDQSSQINEIVERVNRNKTGIFKRDSELIVILPDTIAEVIGSYHIYISEFIIAKVKGKIKVYKGHPKITDEVLYKIPKNLSDPNEILKDIRKEEKREYLFINVDPLHQIVVEVERKPSGLSEINTIFDSDFNELKRLEGKLPTVYSSGDTPISRMHASQ